MTLTARKAIAATPSRDMVAHPEHYNAHPSGVECITVTEHMNFNLGNAVKYIWRHERKNGVEDLKKALWYITREIARVEAARRDEVKDAG